MKKKKLHFKIRKAKQRVEKGKNDVKQKITSSIIDVGLGILSAFFGMKFLSITKVASSIKKADSVMKEKKDVTNSQEHFAFLENEYAKLENKFQEAISKLKEKFSIDNLTIEQVKIESKRSDIYMILI